MQLQHAATSTYNAAINGIKLLAIICEARTKANCFMSDLIALLYFNDLQTICLSEIQGVMLF